MVEQDIDGIKAILKDQQQPGFYWLIDLCHDSGELISAQQAAQRLLARQELVFLADARAFLGELSLAPTPRMRIACLKTIKTLMVKNGPASIELPSFLDEKEAGLWAKKAILHALNKARDLNLNQLIGLECQTLMATLAMEQRGLPFQKSRWQSTLNTLEEESHHLRKALQTKLQHQTEGFELFGQAPLDLHSPGALKTALEKTLGQKLRGTSQESLAHIKHEAVDLLLRLREYERLLSTYGEGFLIKVQQNRLRGTFEPLGTSSGRFSCHSPNLQALPSTPLFRACIDPGPQSSLLSFDYGGFELRILASLSCDQALLDIFNRNLDIHSMVATAVFRTNVSKTQNSHLRDQAKMLNFGIIYGMGEQALARKLDVTPLKARELLNAYFNRFPRVRDFLHELEKSARAQSYCKTILGRRAYFLDDINIDANHKMRVARNMPIQGTGADILKLAMCKVFATLQKNGLEANLVNSIHDELVIECRRELSDEVISVVSGCMQDAFSALLPNLAPEVSVKPFGT